MGRFYRIIFLFALIPILTNAQTVDCDPEQTLAYANEEFNAGHFYSVPSILDDCVVKFNRGQRQRAFLLLTQTYLLLDDHLSAQRSFLEVLWANPEFIAEEQLHAIDLVYYSKRFTATPLFSWFVSAGANVSPVSTIRKLTAVPELDEDSQSFRLRPGYNFGVGGEYSYNDNIRVRIEANFVQSAYATEDFGYFAHGSGLGGEDMRVFVDRQTWLNVPLYISYSDNVGKYRPYGYAGYSLSKLVTDKGGFVLTNAQFGGEGEEQVLEVSSSDFDLFDRRVPLNHSLIFGGGIKYKIDLDFVFVEVRYSAALKNFINTEKEFGDSGLLGNPVTEPAWVNEFTATAAYMHRDDYFRLNNLAITFGFIRPLYKPRELKRVRTKGILRRMKRAQ